MKIAILGYGVEGKSTEKYFKNQEITVFDNFKPEDLDNFNLSSFDYVFRTPSVSLRPDIKANWTSQTKYFFDHCPAKIIGVTGTKGKGTTCSIITELLKSLGKTPYLVGNIGTPPLDILDKIEKNDIVIYEMSSFQLWDLEKSPHISIVLRIKPDHLDVHKNFEDYVNAKANITKHQTPEDYCIFFRDNPDSEKIAGESPAKKVPCPLDERDSFVAKTNLEKDAIVLDGFITYLHRTLLKIFLDNRIRGRHILENAEAALAAVTAVMDAENIEDFYRDNEEKLKTGFRNFKGLPHRLQFIRKLNDVEYYDDSYSSAYPALNVALNSFGEKYGIVLIAGGKDRKLDLSEMKSRIFGTKNLLKAIFIGETKEKLAEHENKEQYELAENLEIAIKRAKEIAEKAQKTTVGDFVFPNIVLMSPGAASFDMFKNFNDRGDKFQKIVKELN